MNSRQKDTYESPQMMTIEIKARHQMLSGSPNPNSTDSYERETW